ncbi:MAG: hypothetical protein GWM98_16665 [Nitrospinaceae bacterium]|nr:radical SAM protein [Nitrospinaceae bacterium]NIR55822.1 radical SAM protein [Nitrospinaceae bacterium]NIS86275.1 radical SAM protein [Nitrospinaceae bacterium]NIT83104.1 radical SAM protein [Nitrospinaceae bacterium]NIU45314.1 radical SAM protein [Nitrospinaceae bacterium]
MLSIFVEVSCGRYLKDECTFCHVYEPLMQMPKSDWHLTPEQAQIMADKIRQVEVLNTLAQHEINLTGGEASQNPDIVDIFKIFKTVTPNVCLHTNLDIKSEETKRWQRLVDIMKQGGRIDITVYPTVWEERQKPLLREIIALQNKLMINIVFESITDLEKQLGLMAAFFEQMDRNFPEVLELLRSYHEKVRYLAENNPDCDEAIYTTHMGNMDSFTRSGDFIFGINLLPAFGMDEQGRRAMASNPFPKNPYLLECVAARGSIEIMTVQQNGNLTPCCDVGNLKCLPNFGNLFENTAAEIEAQFETSRRIIEAGIGKNRANLKGDQAGQWMEEGIPPYCV